MPVVYILSFTGDREPGTGNIFQAKLSIFRASWGAAISRPYSRAIFTTLSTSSALLLASLP
jgi:hypothetical protein